MRDQNIIFPERITGHTLCVLVVFMVCGLANTIWGQCPSTINGFPYTEGFENAPAWVVVEGSSSDWAWGTPAHPLINFAGGGANSWCVGGLTGSFYNYGQQSSLVSPCFDLSTLEYPYISFKLFWEVEQQYDGLGFQYSLDQGSSWSNVGSATSSANCMNQNWFNTTYVNALDLASPKHGWTGRVGPTVGNCAGGQGSGGWVTASHCLLDLAGETSVKFRFIFGSGTICNSYDGIAIDDIFIGEAPPNVASFIFGCQGSTVEFQNNSELCPTSFTWNFGDPGSGAANTSTLANPVHTYAGPGTYQITLTVTGPCNATSTVTLPVSIIEVELQGTDPSCSGTGGSITAQVNGASGPLIYDWTPSAPNSPVIVDLATGNYSVIVQGSGICPVQEAITLSNSTGDILVTMDHSDISCAGMNDGTAVFSVTGGTGQTTQIWTPAVADNAAFITDLGPGTYTVTVTDALGCTGTGSVVIDEPATLQLTASDTLSMCNGGSLQLDGVASGGTAPYVFYYSPTGPTITPDVDTMYEITVTDANGCNAGPVSTMVLVGGPSAPTIIMDVTEGCAPLCVAMNTSGEGTYTWDLGDGVILEGASIQHCLEAGEYDISLLVLDDLRCTNGTVLVDAVLVHPTPVASFSASPPITTISYPVIQFMQTSIGAETWSWTFGDGSDPMSDEYSPVFAYEEVDCFVPVLSVFNEFGCGDEASMQICIEEDLAIYAPNTFTPNLDGLNDEFRILTSVGSPEYFNMRIVDRWGQLIFESRSPDQGWDGTSGNKDLPIGVYIWILRMRDTLGSIQERSGHVTILR